MPYPKNYGLDSSEAANWVVGRIDGIA
ncbi:hypothetical protein CHELA1G11_40093 [Hyphomicrobiales bacterium]|nr:hypothetical protein CHELA1G2_40047 [Hyphomicrobiales bacterium]CAH1696515.1 hypothetical protein CHELA1G11_40093 [Hyphomicrobiales bacterium]